MSKTSMDLAWILVDDFEKAIQFYTDVVGLKVVEMSPEWQWAELQGKSGARVGIGKCQGMTPITAGQNAVLTFTVDHLETTTAEMVKKGASCVGEIQEVPDHVRMQFMRDLDGNLFQLAQVLKT